MGTIAFDLDGTLIDISERDYRIYSDLLVSLGYSPIRKEEYWPLRKDVTDIHKILAMSGCDKKEDVDSFLKQRSEKMEEMEYLRMDSLFEDTISTLAALGENYRLVILTRRHNVQNTISQIRELGLDKLAEPIIVEGDKKEAMKAIEKLQLFVGDTENDIVPANEIGVKSIAVTTGIRNEKRLSILNPTIIINSLSTITKYI